MDKMLQVPAKYMKGAAGYSVDPERGILYGVRGAPLSAKDSDGYIRAMAHKGIVRGYAHRVIWQTVNGDIPDGMVINHINGIKTDNRIENLEVVTPIQNYAHARAMGLADNGGERNGRRHLTAGDVRFIRESSETEARIALLFGISKTHVGRIRRGEAWKEAA